MGSNTSGFINETELRDYINSKEIFDLYSNNIKRFLSDMFQFNLSNTKIICSKIRGQQKPDLSVTSNKRTKYISVKTGSGNSVHQEKLDEFVTFLEDELVSLVAINNLKLFHYGDGTTNNTGKIRHSSKVCRSIYSTEIDIVNKELNQKEILTKILNRVLFLGNIQGGNMTDYVYYGTVKEGIWASREDLLKHFLSNDDYLNTIHFASLTYQVWGRDNNFSAKYPERRHVMQVKWSQIVTDISEIIKENLRK
jgi:hypothetical protein